MFAEDAAIFLADDSLPVSWTPSTGGPAVTGQMLLDAADQDGNPQTVSREYQATLVVASWPGLKRGEVLVVDGGSRQPSVTGSFKLRVDPHHADDGVFATVRLSKG